MNSISNTAFRSAFSRVNKLMREHCEFFIDSFFSNSPDHAKRSLIKIYTQNVRHIEWLAFTTGVPLSGCEEHVVKEMSKLKDQFFEFLRAIHDSSSSEAISKLKGAEEACLSN